MTRELQTLRGTLMDEPEIGQLLEEEGVGTLSMLSDGDPYGIPMSFGYDGDDRLYFVFVGHSDRGRKVTAAERSERVSFLVYDIVSEAEWRSAVVSGPFERIMPDEWEPAQEAMAANAFQPQLLTDVDVRENPNVWVLGAEEMSGRAVGQD